MIQDLLMQDGGTEADFWRIRKLLFMTLNFFNFTIIETYSLMPLPFLLANGGDASTQQLSISESSPVVHDG